MMNHPRALIANISVEEKKDKNFEKKTTIKLNKTQLVEI
jgi:hypothetical protein